MKTKYTFLVATFLILVSLFSCQQDELNINDPVENNSILNKKKPTGGTSFSKGTYTITNQSTDPLYQFSIKGNKITLHSNAEAANWGTDYYGYWSNAFSLSANKVEYTSGLSTTIYEFNSQSNSSVRVIKTLIVAPYQSNGETTTTITTIGDFTK